MARQLTPSEAAELLEKLRPLLGYLSRLVKRMEEVHLLESAAPPHEKGGLGAGALLLGRRRR
jgi:hypothetical protein